MNFKRDQESINPQINLTPLIDVVLMLLIFFMITTSFIAQPGFRVDLPIADSDEVPVKKEIRVIITEDGSCYVNNQLIAADQLQETLVELKKEKDVQVLILKADRRVPHGEVVCIMEKAKLAGIPRIAIATTPRTKKPR